MTELTPARFRAICERQAVKHLPEYLVRLCTEVESGPGDEGSAEKLAAFLNEVDTAEPALDRGWRGPISETWYFENLIGTLIEFMDRQAQKVQSAFAMTAVIKEVFKTIDEVIETREPRLLRGNHRFGKTEGLKAKCAMHPGRLRLVTTTPGNSLRELLVGITDSLGIETSYGCAIGPLRTKIKYVIDQTGIGLVFDEGAWLIPESYSKTTQPARLNWVRSALLDRNVPVVIAVTPQWYDHALEQYLDETHYVMEQFTGRIPAVELPAVLDEGDLVKIAAVHFPEFKRKSDLMEIASEAPMSESFLKAIEQISKHARYMAKRDGAPFTMDLVRKAIRDLSRRPQTTEPNGAEGMQVGSQKAAPKVPRPSAERRLNAPLKAPSRAVQPAEMVTDRGEVFDSCSLRGAGAEMVETDPVPVEV